MKLKKFFVTAFALLTMSAVASSAGIIFADGEEDAGEPDGGETSKAQTEFLFGADGTFEGVKDNTPTDDGVYLGVKSGKEGRAELLRLTIDFDEAVDPSQSTGIFLKMLTPDFNNGSFKVLVEDSEGNHWRMSHGGTVSDPFVLEDGTVSSISMSKNNFAWIANQTGTLYIPWSQTFASVGASGNFLDEEKTRRVESISFYFTLAARSGGSMYYGGLGMTVYSVGTAFVGTDAETSSAQTLLTAASASSTADETKTDAAINYAAVDKGQTYRIDGALNSGMTVITKAGDEGYSDIISYGEISRSDAKLTVNYVDEEGVSLKNSETLTVKFDKAAGEYPYNIEAPVIPDFDYVSSDLPLTGTLPSVNTTVTLTYKPAEIPDTDWDETTSNETYDAAFDENGALSSLIVKSDMNKAVYMGIKKNMTAQQNLYAQLSIGFGEGIDTSKSTGIFVKFLGARENYGFQFMLTDAEGTVYTATRNCVNSDKFTSEEGDVISLTDKTTQHVFKAGIGTWYIPWEYFRALGSEDTKISGETAIVSASFSMNLTKASWYGGYGIKVASAGTVKAGTNKTKVEILFDAATLSYSSDAADTEADVNIADVTKGKKVFCNSAFNGTEVFSTGADCELAVSDVEFAPPSVNVTLKFVDESGKSIRDSEVLSITAGAYELTVPTIMGYVYKSSDKGLTGEVYENTEIVLTYSLAEIKITVKFVDTEGKEIAESEEVFCKYKDIYTVEEKQIDGYEFVESSRKLTGTAMADMTITLTYQTKSGCGAILSLNSVLLCFGVALTAAIGLKKKK